MDTKALRQKILDLAIRGKLVPQDPNDEPASVLLERIREQKKQMVKDGKLKPKDIKNDSIIFVGEDNLHYEKFQDGTVKCIEDEIPFEVPEGWAWERLSNLASFSGGKTPSTSHLEYWDGNILWVTSKDMKSKYITSSQVCLSALGAKQMRIYPPDTLLLVTRSGILRHTLPVAILKECATINQDLKAIILYMPELVEYIYACLKGMETQLLFKYTKSGTTVENVNFDEFQKVLLPIAPLHEISKIIAAINNAAKVVSAIEGDKVALAEYLAKAKAKLLDLAIRGQLVPQNPDDEPTSVLLERIHAEKEELIKQGKIKRDKKESIIFKGEDNSYYQDLPHNWQVSTLREITTPLTLNDGDWILSENMTDNGEVKLLQLGSIGNMSYIDKGFKYLTKDTFDELSCTEIFTGYLIINRIISDKMFCCIVPDIDGTIITTVDTCWIAPTEASYDIKFLMYQLASPSFQSAVLLKATGTTRKRISKNNLIDLHLFLPPLAEQKRIVEAIDTLFAQINKIVEQIS